MEGIQVTLRMMVNSSTAVLGDGVMSSEESESPSSEEAPPSTCEPTPIPEPEYQFEDCTAPCFSNEELSSMLEVDLFAYR